MRFKPFLLLTILVLLLAIPAQAQAFDVTGGYTLSATSPSDDPSTKAVEVRQGESITVNAVATVTNKGMIIITPPLTVTTTLHLKNGADEVATATEPHNFGPVTLGTNETYTGTGSGSIVVPADAAPGAYTLVADAAVDAFGYHKEAHQTFDVRVMPGESPVSEIAPSGDVSTEPEKSPMLAGIYAMMAAIMSI